jgi:calcineurin-like phosphoesterase family protein
VTAALHRFRRLPPKPVAWFHPRELLRTAYHVWLSTAATELLDRREMLAALDRAGPPDQVDGLPSELTLAAGPGSGQTLYTRRNGELWIDFVADVGDSWEATYAIATLLARRVLEVTGLNTHLARAHVVVLGGDLVYPTPSRAGYVYRLRWPFTAALPEAPDDQGTVPCVLAIPGNHDWYDGLTNFVREFCQGGLLGGWRLVQRRSYFAAKLTQGWWLWGIDIALDSRIDAPQQAYFLDVLRNRREPDDAPDSPRYEDGDRIILCTAKPCWLRDPRHSSDAYRNLRFFVKQVIEANGGKVPIILAGDLHHYCRYENAGTAEQLIVSGGGGAYLVGTHHLPRKIDELSRTEEDIVDPNVPEASRARRTAQGGVDAIPREPDEFIAGDFPYPSRTDSRRLALGALLIAFRRANWPFGLFVGALYWLAAWPPRQTLFDDSTRVIVAEAATALICVGFAVFGNSGSRILRTAWGLALALAEIAMAVWLAWELRPQSRVGSFIVSMLPWSDMIASYVLAALLVLLGGLAGATIVGLYLVISDLCFGWHRNEVFAAQSIIDYRNFLRMKIEEDGSLLIFPIGLRRVPRKWRARPNPELRQQGPRYEPADAALRPHLIEGPIRIPPHRV